MLYLSLPVGSFHGWGVCGKYLTRALSRLTPVTLLAQQFNEKNLADPLDYTFLQRLWRNPATLAGQMLEAPVLHSIGNKMMQPGNLDIRSRVRNVGYSFFEDNLLPPEAIENARRYFDVVITGSAWCEEILRSYGLTEVTTVIQGVDTQIFNPIDAEKKYFLENFVIFSGGKFELRKGQDLVIRAVKHMQDKYPDVMLVNSWFNMWAFSLNTMRVSPHIRLVRDLTQNYVPSMMQVLADNGLDLQRVVTLGPQPNSAMARIYKNSDVGVFPNRCEGGTNLVMMEYMACGKPVIASYNTGHKDVLTEDNARLLTRFQTGRISDGQKDIAVWDFPELDELIDQLEWAYHHRDVLAGIGTRAGQYMSQCSWDASAQGFYQVLQPTSDHKAEALGAILSRDF
jgi:glycosyltransferase involved in cell wall biosynthesis